MQEIKRDTDVQNRVLESMGEGEGGMIWEQHRNVYITKCETDHQSRLDAWGKCSRLVHWDDPERRDGEGFWRGIQDEEYM